MVGRNVSQFAGAVPLAAATDGNRLIGKARIYDAASVLAMARSGNINLWSSGARRDAAKWSLDTENLAELLVLALQHGRFLGAEWCQSKSNGPWAACEAWVVTRAEWNQNAAKNLQMTYYLKFAIAKTGKLLLMASNHPEGT